LQKLGATILGYTHGHWSFNPLVNRESSREEVKSGLAELLEFIKNEHPDLLILDEILISVRDGVLHEHELLDFISQKPAALELVLTGRGASDGLIEVSDYVSRIEKVKHPFDRKIYSREGIEFSSGASTGLNRPKKTIL